MANSPFDLFIDEAHKLESKSKYLQPPEAVVSNLVDANDLPEEIKEADFRCPLFKIQTYKDNEI